MNINDKLQVAIEEFIASQSNKDKKKTITNVLDEKFISEIKDKITMQDLKEEKESALIQLKDAMEEVMIGLKFSKRSGYNIFDLFLKYLNKNYNTNLKIGYFIKKPLEDTTERKIDMLKKLQGDGKTADELSEIYTLRARTIHKDLTALEKGIDFLQQYIKIDLESKNGKKYYSSTVHPIFLPLNMTEVYAMTVGLKKVAKNTLYQSILDDMADWIYSQLSPYAHKIINKSLNLQRSNISYSAREQKFLKEDCLFDKNRKNRLIYMEKRREYVRIIFKEKEEAKEVEGRISCFINDMIGIETEGSGYLKVPYNDIVDIQEIKK